MKTEHLNLDGVRGFVMATKDGGKFITVTGWTNHWRFEEKQNVILHNDDGTSTRYKILKINRPGDPPDMYFLDLQFNPRK